MRRLLLVATFAFSMAAEESVLFPIYSRYLRAVEADDLAKAKTFLSEGKVKNLEGMEESEALSSLNVLSPKEDLRMHKEIIDGDDATLIVLANVAENESVGRIQFVRAKGKWKILSEMWDIGGDPNDTPAAVRQPANDEQRAAIQALRERGFPSPSEDFLVMTAATGDLEALKLFVKAGYSVNAKQGGTPAIVQAASFGHEAIVRYLIDAGADVNATDSVNTTALMRLAEKCDATETLRALLKAGATKSGKTAGGMTTLQLAEMMNCEENAKLLR